MRIRRSKLGGITGAHIAYYAFEQNPDGTLGDQLPMVGRATRANFNDQYRVLPISEIGNDGINEFVYGQHAGQFRMDKVLGTNRFVEQYLPQRDEHKQTHLEIKPFTLISVITAGEYKGYWLDQFRNCKVEQKSGSVQPNAIFQGQLSIKYSYHNINPIFLEEEVVDARPTTG